MAKNTIARLHGIKDLRIEEVDVPDVGAGQVLLRPRLVGMCGSDLHFYRTGEIGSYILKKPIALGHEISAEVCQLGEGVTGLEIGDKVAVDPMRACKDCFYCKIKRDNLCTKCDIAGIPNTDGGFANYMVSPASTCYKLPEGVSLAEGAMFEPLSISVWGFRRCPVVQGEAVVIIGAGTIGLLAAQVARAHGAGQVLVTDPVQSRLDLARSLGDFKVMKVDPKDGPEMTAENIKVALGSEADLCVECSGAPGTVDSAIFATRRAGRILMLGLGEMSFNCHLGLAALNEVDIIGAICNNHVFPECVDLVASGKVKVAPLISKVIPLQQIKDALDILDTGATDVIKIQIQCQN